MQSVNTKIIKQISKLEKVNEIERRRLIKTIFYAGSLVALSACNGGTGDDSPDVAQNKDNPPTPPAETDNSSSNGINNNVPRKLISSFSIAMLPDTQFYPRYASEKDGMLYQKLYHSIDPRFDNPFKTQTQWLVQNQVALNLAFCAHLGDVVDQHYYYGDEATQPWTVNTDLTKNGQLSNKSVTREWDLASQAMQVLEDAKLPYSICAGNHDVGSWGKYLGGGPDWGVGVSGFNNNDGYQDGGLNRAGVFQPYLQVFPKERAEKNITFKARHSSGFHEYHIFEAEGNKFLVLSMSWRASDAAIAWAADVINQNQNIPVILICHQLAGIGANGKTAADTAYSNYLWNKLIKSNDQIFMAVSGHYHGSCSMVKKNDWGNDVFLMVVDYQMAYMGGNGLMRLYEFNFTDGIIKGSSFSPWVPLKPDDTLNNFDQAWLSEDNQNFTLPINFKERFKNFNPSFSIKTGSREGEITDVAKKIILTNFSQTTQVAGTPAKSLDDFPASPNTVAHWKFYNPSAKDGDKFPYSNGQMILDYNLAGQGALQLNTWMGRDGDLVWSTSHHPLSSTPGSLKFLNSTKTRASYFTPISGAPILTNDFSHGYTLEVFLLIDPAFDVNINGWMGILYGLGARNLYYNQGGGDTTLMLALSNLMEFQWEVVPLNRHDGVACWSGSISAGQWLHLAIVNDPSENYATTMYVEGAPVLRNNSSMHGILPPRNIAIGCGQYANSMNTGFFGSLGEIRLVNQPLPQNKWLTARRNS